MGVQVNVVAPLGASAHDLSTLPNAWFNVVLYPETALMAAQWLQRNHKQPFTRTMPIGVRATDAFVREVAALAGLDPDQALAQVHAAHPSRSGWYSRSVDSTYLTGKCVFIFGDASHAVAAARVASEEMGFTVVGLGTYSREFARDVREAAEKLGLQALITDDYLEVEQQIAALQPELVLGTQMERHIAKRLGVPCTVISAPVHVQDFPARYAPQMGYEGANVLFDTWVHPLMMGLEEHLLQMFRSDFEFNDAAPASHLGHKAAPQPALEAAPTHAAIQAAPLAQPLADLPPSPRAADPIVLGQWSADAERELGKIPFFVRGKARRNTERYAQERGVPVITIETLYDAKAHYSR
jgi:light-independent protochlorophyllide reductase subunit B